MKQPPCALIPTEELAEETNLHDILKNATVSSDRAEKSSFFLCDGII